ncbi:MAG: hypothetical protein KDE53_33805, partial [Caldilineaceae bacterium]|nr:hypothetical protein [Caldilineaceae bacterium]
TTALTMDQLKKAKERIHGCTFDWRSVQILLKLNAVFRNPILWSLTWCVGMVNQRGCSWHHGTVGMPHEVKEGWTRTSGSDLPCSSLPDVTID